MSIISSKLATPALPSPEVIKVDTRGAVILHEESFEVRGFFFFHVLCAMLMFTSAVER